MHVRENCVAVSVNNNNRRSDFFFHLVPLFRLVQAVLEAHWSDLVLRHSFRGLAVYFPATRKFL